MKTFHISLGKGLDVDVLKLVESRVGICANSGAGKSHLMRLLVEKIAGRIPVHILDWEGEYRTLCSQIDAVYVAKNGDIAPQVSTASKLARKLLEKRVSTIIDISSMARIDRLNFVAAYLEGLLDVPASLWTPIMVFIDECHRLAPEVASKGGGKELTSAIHRSRSAVIALMDSGRKRSIGGVLATQRLAKVTKDAFSEANSLFIGRFSADTDLKRVGEHFGLDAGERDAFRTFKAGEFLARGVAINNDKSTPTKFRSFDTKTKAPKYGDTVGASQPSRTMKKILEELATLPQEVEKEIKDLKEAKAEIARLQKELKAKPVNTEEFKKLKYENTELHRRLSKKQLPSKEILAAAEVRGAEQAEKRFLEKRKHTQKLLDKLFVSVQKLATVQADLHHPLMQLSDENAIVLTPQDKKLIASTHNCKMQRLADKAVAIERKTKTDVLVGPRSNSKLPFSWRGAPGKLLTVMLQYHPEELTLQRTAAIAGLNSRSSTFRNAISKLRTTGMLGPQDKLTDLALSFRDDVEALPAGEELIEGWRNKLGNGVPRRVFDALLDEVGVSTKEAIAEMAETDGSTFRNALSKLRTLGLLEPGRGEELKLTEHVMEAM